ncbi:tetraspanin-9 [Drosophila tropicalis]|uniref:tetraspanin-9 n=1 Tax=Drosophila tropicalis TaxID=46794 RepID=UPI0035AB9164
MYCTKRQTLSYTLCLINLLCALWGSLLIWYGCWLLDNLTNSQNIEIEHGENLAAILTILLGIVIVVASIYGSVGVCQESRTVLISYAVLLLVLLIIQVIMFSISFAASRDALPESLRQGFDELWDVHHLGNSTLNIYEEWLHCCGRNKAEDYVLVGKELPSSCCLDKDCTKVLNLFMSGCEVKFKAYVSDKTANFNILSWLLIITEFAGSVISCYLADSIRNHRDRVRFYN